MATLREPFALDRSLNTTESPSRNIADVLAEELSAMITAIGGLNFINFVVVAELPTTGISTTTIYLVPSDDPQSENTYDEYINLNGTVSGWEKIGSTDIDLSGYYTSAEVDDLLADKADVSDIPTVNDGTLTIQQNGEAKGTFTANQSGNSTVNIEIPTTDIQTAVDEFETYNGGLLSECIIELVPVQSGSGDPSPDNVRPISGHTEVKVGDDGKNRFNPNSYESFDITGGGAIRYGHEFDSGEYTLINNGTDSSGYYYRIVAKDYSSYGSSVQITNNTSVNVTVDNSHFLRVFTASWDDTAENIAVIEGTNETFVPYNGYQVTVNLGGTYYSGTLDVVTGVFTPDTAEDDLGTLTWTYDSGTQRFTSSVTGLKNLPVRTAPMTCEVYKVIDDGRAIADVPDGSIYNGNMSSNIYVHDSRFTTPSDLATALSGYKLVYPLANPTPIQLSPTMVKALVGENHLSAPLDGQEITESKYKQTFTFDDVIAYIQSLS